MVRFTPATAKPRTVTFNSEAAGVPAAFFSLRKNPLDGRILRTRRRSRLIRTVPVADVPLAKQIAQRLAEARAAPCCSRYLRRNVRSRTQGSCTLEAKAR